ncbi:MAG: hypothetical protein M0C28_46300 [Candidatus Moduliflexus flocculans]|nr:hypothetical protein [Candidatus Moduliflexus flocculans]
MTVLDLGDERQEPGVEVDLGQRTGQPVRDRVEALPQRARRGVPVEPAVPFLEDVPEDLEVGLERLDRDGPLGIESGRSPDRPGPTRRRRRTIGPNRARSRRTRSLDASFAFQPFLWTLQMAFPFKSLRAKNSSPVR